MLLINCEIKLILIWPANFVIWQANRGTTFEKTETKFYVPVVFASIQDNTKLLQQLISGFKCIFTWNKYQPNVSTQALN